MASSCLPMEQCFFARKVGVESSRVVFDCFNLTSLRPIADPASVAARIRYEKCFVSPLPQSHEKWENRRV